MLSGLLARGTLRGYCLLLCVCAQMCVCYNLSPSQNMLPSIVILGRCPQSLCASGLAELAHSVAGGLILSNPTLVPTYLCLFFLYLTPHLPPLHPTPVLLLPAGQPQATGALLDTRRPLKGGLGRVGGSA